MPTSYREVPGFLGRYLAGTDGTVWSLWNKGRWGGWRSKPHKLTVFLDKRGYCQVGITVKNKSRLYFVHQLVLLTFVGPKPDGKETRHRNGVKTDNRLSNLSWGTPLENAADRNRHGTQVKGSSCHWATIDERVAAKIKRDLLAGLLPVSIAKRYQVARSLVYNIKQNKAWKHVKPEESESVADN